MPHHGIFTYHTLANGARGHGVRRASPQQVWHRRQRISWCSRVHGYLDQALAKSEHYTRGIHNWVDWRGHLRGNHVLTSTNCGGRVLQSVSEKNNWESRSHLRNYCMNTPFVFASVPLAPSRCIPTTSAQLTSAISLKYVDECNVCNNSNKTRKTMGYGIPLFTMYEYMIYIYIYTYSSIHIYIYIHSYVYVCVFVYNYVYIYICVCVRGYLYHFTSEQI